MSEGFNTEQQPEGEKNEEIISDIIDIINAPQSNPLSNTNTQDELIDINITELADILAIIDEKEYDLFILDPRNDDIKISFRKNSVEKEVRYVKFPIYNTILLKLKDATNLQVAETQVSQEGKGIIPYEENSYNIVSKTAPSAFGEKILIKLKKKEKVPISKKNKKASLGAIMSFLAISLVVILIIGGSFIGFIVSNAKTVEDVKFFSSLGISLNDINLFISKTVGIIFSILIFLETLFLAIFLFKFFLTKKIYKRKKISYAIISGMLLFFTFSTATAWLFIDKKISSLPNWQEMSYGQIQIYDNDKLINANFDKQSALIESTASLIGPVTLKYDLSYWAKNEEQQGFSIKKFIWNFDGDIIEEVSPILIRKFDSKGTFDVSVKIIGFNVKGDEIEKILNSIQPVNISNFVKIEEKTLKSGGITIKFDAKDIKTLGKVNWYFLSEEDYSPLEPVYTGYNFQPSTIIFEDTLIGMSIQRDGEKSTLLDKIFIISKKEVSSIDGTIEFTQDIVHDLKYNFTVKNPNTNFGDGFIESFRWKLSNHTFNLTSDFENLEKSSKIEHSFSEYGEHFVSVELQDSSGKIKTLKTVINIPKRIHLRNQLKITHNNSPIDNIRYESKNHEYFIDELGSPTTLTLDASQIKSSNILYKLKSVSWDTDEDGQENNNLKVLPFRINTEGNYIIEVSYLFEHRKILNEIQIVKERIYIESIKKDAILDLQISSPTKYVPVGVSFDASKSQVKGKNIEKFIFDYGDGIIEERDAINPSHNYSQPGEYNIILKVVTEDGMRYSLHKKLILKAKPETVKAVSSMKSAATDQGIDFGSQESQGQIIGYLWDFGDGELSTDANPTHSYEVEGKYTVTLTANFQNKNSLTDEIDIIISNQE